MSLTRQRQVREEAPIARRLLCGSVAGLVATVPMTVVMEVLRRALPPVSRDPLPPRRVAVGLARRLGFARYLDRDDREGLTWLSHFGYGAGTGAGYGVVEPALRSALPHPAASGAAFGVCVWLLSYFGWLPVAGITSPQFRHPLRRNTTLVLSHLAWGVTTGVLTDRLTRPRPRRQRIPEPPTRRPLPRKHSVGVA